MDGALKVVFDAISGVRSMLPFAAAASTPMASVVDISPVLLAILVVMVTVTVLTHWRHAVGSIPIPAGVPLLPGSVPLLGHCIPALTNLSRLHDWLFECVQRMGEGRTFAFSLPFLPSSIVVTDPVCLEHVLKKKCDNYPKGPRFFLNFGPVLGHGIFTSDGDAWYWQRKLATHIFSVKSFKMYIDTVFEDKMQLLTGVVSSAASSGRPLDLHDLMYRFTLDSFGQIGFGVDVGCLRTADKVPFAAAFDSAQVILNERFWLPGWQILELLNGTGSTLRGNVATVKAFALDIVQRRRKQLAAAAAAGGGALVSNRRDQGPAATLSSTTGSQEDANDVAADNSASAVGAVGAVGAGVGAGGGVTEKCEEGEAAKDLLSLFMQVPGPDGKPLNTQQLIDTVLNFIIAGRDTTAQALSWTFYLLMQHPEVEQKLLEEIHEVLGPVQQQDAAAAAAGSAAGRATAGVQQQDTASTASTTHGKGASSTDSDTDSKAAAAADSSSGTLHPSYDNAQQDAAASTNSKGASSADSDTGSKAAAAADSSSGTMRPSYDQLRRLRYARAVFMEALRLYPSVPENCKYAVHRDVLPDGTVVPAGAQVIYSAYLGNRLGATWGPDPLVFRPERWLEMEKTPSPVNYLTFNAGPRLCLGQRLAELEGVFVLTGLLARFRFRQAVPGSKVTYTLSPTMPMKEGLHVFAEVRA